MNEALDTIDWRRRNNVVLFVLGDIRLIECIDETGFGIDEIIDFLRFIVSFKFMFDTIVLYRNVYYTR